MSKERRKSSARKGMRGQMYFHVLSILILAGICLYLSICLHAWEDLLRFGRLSAAVVLAAAAVMICLVDIYMFIRSVFKTMAELEHTLNVLEESAREDGTCYEESDGLMRQKTPTELLQVLLQREAAAQIMTKEAEINALQSQINPHFLYNTLETIRGQALCCGATSIADATKALAEIFRYNISQKGAMISLKEELANIDAYMRIQSIRFNDRFTLHSDVAEDTLYIQIPKLLVQPVIENALKHGLEVKRGKGNIWISAFRTANRLEIAVEDDGVGISPTILKALNEKLAQGQAERLGSSTTSNIGLANINERIKLIYGTDYGVTVLSAEQQGTRVILSLGILS